MSPLAGVKASRDENHLYLSDISDVIMEGVYTSGPCRYSEVRSWPPGWYLHRVSVGRVCLGKPDVKCDLADFTDINKLFIGRRKVKNIASLPAMSEI